MISLSLTHTCTHTYKNTPPHTVMYFTPLLSNSAYTELLHSPKFILLHILTNTYTLNHAQDSLCINLGYRVQKNFYSASLDQKRTLPKLHLSIFFSFKREYFNENGRYRVLSTSKPGSRGASEPQQAEVNVASFVFRTACNFQAIST